MVAVRSRSGWDLFWIDFYLFQIKSNVSKDRVTSQVNPFENCKCVLLTYLSFLYTLSKFQVCFCFVSFIKSSVNLMFLLRWSSLIINPSIKSLPATRNFTILTLLKVVERWEVCYFFCEKVNIKCKQLPNTCQHRKLLFFFFKEKIFESH